MRPRSIDDFLKRARVPYTTFSHAPGYSAERQAAISHTPGNSWAKSVVCFAEGEPIIVVVPAPFMVDFDAVRMAAGTRVVRLARESELPALYLDCQPGAMPPFGSLYRQRTFVDRRLVGETGMVFNAGRFTEAIRMHYGDFMEIVRPFIGAFARPRSGELRPASTASNGTASADRPAA